MFEEGGYLEDFIQEYILDQLTDVEAIHLALLPDAFQALTLAISLAPPDSQGEPREVIGASQEDD
eukprot:4840414-Karenia_brevis.AAC.1